MARPACKVVVLSGAPEVPRAVLNPVPVFPPTTVSAAFEGSDLHALRALVVAVKAAFAPLVACRQLEGAQEPVMSNMIAALKPSQDASGHHVDALFCGDGFKDSGGILKARIMPTLSWVA